MYVHPLLYVVKKFPFVENDDKNFERLELINTFASRTIYLFKRNSTKREKRNMMIKQNLYESPAIEVVEIEVEQGFALSGIFDGSDYGDGGEGDEME